MFFECVCKDVAVLWVDCFFLSINYSDFLSTRSKAALNSANITNVFFRNICIFSTTCRRVSICSHGERPSVNPPCLILRFLRSVLKHLYWRVDKNSLAGTESNIMLLQLVHRILDSLCF